MGIKRVVYRRQYPASLKDVRRLSEEANIEFIQQKMESIPLVRLNL